MLKMIATLCLLSAAIVSTPQVQPRTPAGKTDVQKRATDKQAPESQEKPAVKTPQIVCETR
jgi:hypothetical protein